MGGPMAVQTSQALQPCFKCNGNGYCHDSSMPHDKGPNEKCFFCKSCCACGGSGAIQGGTTTVQQVGMQGMMGGAVVTQTQGLQPCFKCDGKGWCHNSNMPHDKGPSEKCFFCKSCDTCSGSGAIQGGSTTVQQMGINCMPCAHGPMWNPNAWCSGSRAEERATWLVQNQFMSMEAAKQQVMREFPAEFNGAGASHGLHGMWNPHAMCDGSRAEERALWLQQNKGMTEYAARQQVMNEFPSMFHRM